MVSGGILNPRETRSRSRKALIKLCRRRSRDAEPRIRNWPLRSFLSMILSDICTQIESPTFNLHRYFPPAHQLTNSPPHHLTSSPAFPSLLTPVPSSRVQKTDRKYRIAFLAFRGYQGRSCACMLSECWKWETVGIAVRTPIHNCQTREWQWR